MKQKLKEMQGEIDKPTGDFNTFSINDRKNRHKIHEDMEDLNNTIN